MKWNGKVCVITGASNGIGRCLALEFAQKGALVAMMDVDGNAGKETLERVKAVSGGFFYQGDVACREALEAFSRLVIETYGHVDFLINNAGISKKGLLSGCSYEDFETVLRIGVTAPYYLTSLFLPFLGKNAAIVNIASTRAFMSQPDWESYASAKGGISALTHAMAISLAGKARANAISPGWIDTGAYHGEGYEAEYTKGDIFQHPSCRVGEPGDIARLALFLCDEANSFINGENIKVDGGMTKVMAYDGEEGWSFDPPGEQ